MRVISTLNDKGGTGKTTVAVNLAGCLVEAGSSVLVLDLDAQAAAKQWADQEAPFPFAVEAIELEGARKFKQRLDAAAREMKADYVLVDCPPELREASMTDRRTWWLAAVGAVPLPYRRRASPTSRRSLSWGCPAAR